MTQEEFIEAMRELRDLRLIVDSNMQELEQCITLFFIGYSQGIELTREQRNDLKQRAISARQILNQSVVAYRQKAQEILNDLK